MYKLLISFIFLLFCFFNFEAKAETYVSISPAMTEIMYAIGAQDKLLAVSTTCEYPNAAMDKEKVGNNFFINEEKILKLRPDYILALDSSEFMLNKFKRFGIKPLCFKYPDIESVYQNILTLGKLASKEKQAQKVVHFSKRRIAAAKNGNKVQRKILYLVDTNPIITIGKKSFIADVIEKSGNISITSGLNSYYPVILEEYAVKQKPDIVVISFYSDDKRIKKLFPNTKIIRISKEENDIINRPGPRIYKAVEFFARI